MVLNILSACKAEERGVAIATASDDNAADGKIDSASRPDYQVVSALRKRRSSGNFLFPETWCRL